MGKEYMKDCARNSNIELLRIFAIIGVIILHYNNMGIGGALSYAPLFSINSMLLYFLQAVFVCAVDLFILITGYYLSTNKEVTFKKPIMLIAQVIVYNQLLYFIAIIERNKEFSLCDIISNLLPTNYFVILYIGIYCLSPYINKLLSVTSKKSLNKLLLILFVGFSLQPTLVDVLSLVTRKEYMGLNAIGMYGSGQGYTITNFLLMYIIGAALRITDIKWKRNKCILGLVISYLLITVWSYYERIKIGYSVTAWEYCNPIVIIIAILTFMIFLGFKEKHNKIINCMAKACFSVFLLHVPFLLKFNIEKYAIGNTIILILHIGLVCAILYIGGWIVSLIYNGIIKIIEKAVKGRMSFFTVSSDKE